MKIRGSSMNVFLLDAGTHANVRLSSKLGRFKGPVLTVARHQLLLYKNICNCICRVEFRRIDNIIYYTTTHSV